MKKVFISMAILALCLSVVINREKTEKNAEEEIYTVKLKNKETENINWDDYTIIAEDRVEERNMTFQMWLFNHHLFLMWILWGPITDFSISLAMWFKHEESWYQLTHVILQNIVNFLTIFFGLFIWCMHIQGGESAVNPEVLKQISINTWYKYIHGFAVQFLFLAILFIHFCGAYVYWYGNSEAKLKPFFWKAKRWHKNVTHWVYYAAKLQLVSGTYLQIGKKAWPIQMYCIYYDIWIFRIPDILIWYAIYQIPAWIGMILIQKAWHNPADDAMMQISARSKLFTMTENHTEILKQMDQCVPPKQILVNNPSIKWCTHENNVYDITNFKHPGGHYIAIRIYGRDVGRFITGSYMLEDFSDLPGYTHSPHAFAILERYKFGELKDETFRICKRSHSHDDQSSHHKNTLDLDHQQGIELTKTFVNESRVSDDQDQEWDFMEMEAIGQDTFIYHFKAKYHTVKNWMQGTRWLARHFMLNFKEDPRVCRLYTTIQSYSKENRRQLQALLHYYQKLRNNERDFQPNYQPLEDEEMSYRKICFVIKHYPFPGGLSNELYEQFHNAEEFEERIHAGQKHINIRGPFGLGVGIPENASGNYVLIAGGTGILPFLDFFFLLLKKATYKYFDEQDSQIGRLFKSQNYSKLFKGDFSITFYGAFRADADFYGKEIIDNLYKVCQETGNQEFFNGFLKISKRKEDYNMPVTKERFTAKFFKGKVSNDTERFLICGPPRMMQGTPPALIANGIDPFKIELV